MYSNSFRRSFDGENLKCFSVGLRHCRHESWTSSKQSRVGLALKKVEKKVEHFLEWEMYIESQFSRVVTFSSLPSKPLSYLIHPKKSSLSSSCLSTSINYLLRYLECMIMNM
jgi:hypothetical protein